APRDPWLSVKAPTANDFWGITFGNGLFVAGGNFGTVFTSTDGANWTARTPGTNQVNLYAVTFGPNGFAAVGVSRQSPGQPVVWTYTNGADWSPQDATALDLTSGNSLQAVTYAAGLYVAVGGNISTNTISTSPD